MVIAECFIKKYQLLIILIASNALFAAPVETTQHISEKVYEVRQEKYQSPVETQPPPAIRHTEQKKVEDTQPQKSSTTIKTDPTIEQKDSTTNKTEDDFTDKNSRTISKPTLDVSVEQQQLQANDPLETELGIIITKCIKKEINAHFLTASTLDTTKEQEAFALAYTNLITYERTKWKITEPENDLSPQQWQMNREHILQNQDSDPVYAHFILKYQLTKNVLENKLGTPIEQSAAIPQSCQALFFTNIREYLQKSIVVDV